MSRRSLLTGAAVTLAAGVAGYLVAASSSLAKRKNGTTAANAYGATPSPTGRALVPLAQIPIGGGIVLTATTVVLTRSGDGALHAFSAVCTHQGCIVNSVQNGQIVCPCHGSRYDAFTGAVVTGPAPRSLPPVSVTVQGGEVYEA